MKAEQWRRVDELLERALELDEPARARFLDEACAGDPALRAEVEAMLRFARESEDFLETPVIVEPALLTGKEEARFIPGDMVAARYRIVGLLGRGGMGEVYRADDLKLGQPVALKFLAESLSTNGAALARFHREVSFARQISHRHVCRVYDIGEHAGMHFLSMEYVRGEELSSLLKRIGRLPLDKAVETARQLCAGLAAIHAAGVLHRDLKPANVMIDQHGDVRITDFGVAALSEGVSGVEAMIGTPAYMAPEQRAGGELTTRSDLYALGLVLFEAFTGKRPSAEATLPDPIVERIILRCLEKDPARRPASALQVAAALPGGDPLAAALAAGETPSPQMVAASAREGSLRPLHAALLLSAIVGGIAIAALGSRTAYLHRYVPLELSSEALRARAAAIVLETGYGAATDDVASGFQNDLDAVRHETNWQRFRRAPLPAMPFWYRRSPRPLVAYDLWQVAEADPPNDLAGMVRLRLDTEGRLLFFEAVPPQEESPRAQRTADWGRFFEHAGLSMDAFRAAAPRWTPPHHSDARLSWTGVHPQRADVPVRIEAAAYRGAPVWFEVVFPWQKPMRQPVAGAGTPDDPVGIGLVMFYFGAIALASLLAWKNIRLGRGDRRGAFRLVLFGFCVRMVYWAVIAHHVAAPAEVRMFVSALQAAVYWAVLTGLLYLALEPFVRRRRPEGLISWSRLLGGEMRDPLVGRDILIGGALGVAAILANQLIRIVPPMHAPSVNSPLLTQHAFHGIRGFLALLMNQISASILFPLIITAVLLFFAMITRSNRAAVGVSWLLFYGVLTLNFSDGRPIGYVIGLLLPTLLMLALTRYGLLALMSFFFFLHLGAFYPVTTELTAWYATTFLLQLAVLAGVTFYALRISAGRIALFDD